MKTPESFVAFRILQTETEKTRLLELWKTASSFYPEQIQDAFVSETRDETGRLIVDSIWFFTGSLAAEFKNPMQEDDFDATPLRDITYLQVTKKDFELSGAPTQGSRMTVFVRFSEDIAGTLRASAENCSELVRIARQVILPHLLTE